MIAKSTLVSDGVRIQYRVLGTGSRSVILVHGWMVSGAVFDALLQRLNLHGLRLIVPDLRGTGDSDKPASGHTLAGHADDVMAVMKAEGCQQAVLIGHSMGGQISQWIAATQPGLVAGLVLLCPVPAQGMALPPDAQALFRTCAGNRAAQGVILGLACKQLAEDAKERLLDVAATVSEAAIQQGFDAWTTGGFADQLGKIRVPTLVLATDDPFLPPTFLSKTVVEPIKHARLVMLPGPGHYVPVERPSETAAVIDAFLAGLSGLA